MKRAPGHPYSSRRLQHRKGRRINLIFCIFIGSSRAQFPGLWHYQWSQKYLRKPWAEGGGDMQPVHNLTLKWCLAWATFAFEKQKLSHSYLHSWLKTQQQRVSHHDLYIWRISTNWISTDNLQLLEQKARHNLNLQDSTVKGIQILHKAISHRPQY